ncbi:MAG: hypothetical protein QNJ91_16140, partial [Gammaproteobacteria bacterium]|nr:hypothetical protein [Gammaproteobacteria bacterium]
TPASALPAAPAATPAARPAAGLPAALDATVIGALARETTTPTAPADPAPAPAELPRTQMDMLRDVFAPEMPR